MLLLGARAHDYPHDTPANVLRAIGADGWKTVQLAPKKAFPGVESAASFTPAYTDEVRTALSENGLSVGVWGAYVELSMADEAARGEAVRQFLSWMPIAKTLCAGCIGSETTNRAKQPDVPQEKALLCLEHSLEQILPEAERLGLTVAIEPVFYHTMSTPELTRRVLNDLGSKHLKVIFDPVNLFAPQWENNQRALWDSAFDAFAADIAAVHMKGVRFENGVAQSAPFAQSVVDYAYIFETLRRLPQTLPVLREEVVPAMAAQDMAFLSGFCRG